MNGSTIGLVATICGGLFIGYCIYFDKKRRADPNYKKKIIEKRKRQSEEEERNSRIVLDFNDPIAVQRFFLQELELGEELLRTGNWFILSLIVYSMVDISILQSQLMNTIHSVTFVETNSYNLFNLI